MPSMSARANIIGIPKVNGRISATAIVAETPGMAPSMSPIKAPAHIAIQYAGSKKFKAIWEKISIASLSLSSKIPPEAPLS